MTDPSFYKPENHPFTQHHTYTGPGCAHCGKPVEVHSTIAPPVVKQFKEKK